MILDFLCFSSTIAAKAKVEPLGGEVSEVLEDQGVGEVLEVTGAAHLMVESKVTAVLMEVVGRMVRVAKMVLIQ